MANINSTLDTSIWSEDGQTAATVDELSTSAKGLSVSPLGVYMSSDPSLVDGQVYPIRISASGNIITEASLLNVDIDNRQIQGAVSLNTLPGGVVTDWGNLSPRTIGEYSPLLVTPSGRLLVETYPAPTASGVAQKTIITDADGNDVNVNADGSLQVTFSTGASSITRMIELRCERSIGLNTVDVWQNILTYTVPDGYSLELIDFTSAAANNTSWARASTNMDLGSYDIATSTFTDGSAYTSPYYGAKIELEVTTAVVGACTVTVTYTNHLGVTGRTGTVTIPTGAIVGEAFAVLLQTGDYGVSDVTNITTVGGTSGAFDVHGVVVVFVEQMTTSNQTYHQITSRESIIIGEGETVDLGIRSGQKAAVTRYIHVLGQLRSIVGG